MFKNFGEYAAGYDREIHGPYDPARYYGKPDTRLAETKLIDLPAWLMRRSFNPFDWVSACSRAYWRWQHKWIFPKRIGAAGLHQMVFFFSTTTYLMGYSNHVHERKRKYH